MDIDYTVGEVELSYKPKFKNIYKVGSSEDAYKYLLPTYKEGTICYKEYFKVLFLNQSSQVLGYTLISEGGITETCADVWKIQCKLPPKTKRFCPLVLK